MNEYARNNRYFSNAKEFRQHIRHFFNVTLPDIADTTKQSDKRQLSGANKTCKLKWLGYKGGL